MSTTAKATTAKATSKTADMLKKAAKPLPKTKPAAKAETKPVQATNKVKKQSTFVKYWRNLSEQQGTINFCLRAFVDLCEVSEKSDFNTFVLNQVGKNFKDFNKYHYKGIKCVGKVGEVATITRKIKGGEQIIQYTRKCSLFVVYRYFWKLYKAQQNGTFADLCAELNK